MTSPALQHVVDLGATVAVAREVACTQGYNDDMLRGNALEYTLDPRDDIITPLRDKLAILVGVNFDVDEDQLGKLGLQESRGDALTECVLGYDHASHSTLEVWTEALGTLLKDTFDNGKARLLEILFVAKVEKD